MQQGQVINEDKFGRVFDDVRSEFVVASRRFPAMRSKHEGIAIIEEEFLELRDSVYVRGHSRDYQYHEAVQLAAMAVRFIYDLMLQQSSE